MKKLITLSIVLLCLGGVSFAQTAKTSVSAPPKSKGPHTEKNKTATAQNLSLKAALTSTTGNITTGVQPEVSLPVQKQN